MSEAGKQSGASKSSVPVVAPAAAAAEESSKGFGTLVKRAADKVPTKWVTTAVGLLVLGATAFFGGLDPVEATPPTELAAGETHVGPLLSVTVERAVLIDNFTEAGASADPEAGERVLALVTQVENVSDDPVAGFATHTAQVLRLESFPETSYDGIARTDDATIGPTLQPGVPAQVVFSWVVPGDTFAAGDEVRVGIFDHTLYTGQIVFAGDLWSDPTLAATVTVPIEDVGAGADQEEGQ